MHIQCTIELPYSLHVYNRSYFELHFSDRITVPSGALMTMHEIMFFPEYVVNMKYPNLTLYTALPRGGKNFISCKIL